MPTLVSMEELSIEYYPSLEASLSSPSAAMFKPDSPRRQGLLQSFTSVSFIFSFSFQKGTGHMEEVNGVLSLQEDSRQAETDRRGTGIERAIEHWP